MLRKVFSRHTFKVLGQQYFARNPQRLRRFASGNSSHSTPKLTGSSSGGKVVPGVLFAILIALGPGYYYIKPASTVQVQEKNETAVPRIESVPFVQYVLIGGGTSSFGALEAIREREPDADILVISKEDWIPYQRPPLSKELWTSEQHQDLKFKDWQGNDASLFYKGSYYFINDANLNQVGMKTLKIKFMPKSTVEKLDVEQQLLQLPNFRIQYGKLLIATGGSPRKPDFLTNMDKALSSKIDDFKKLHALAQPGKKIAIVGGGFLGSEIAAALISKKCEVVQVFPEEGNVAHVLPKYLSKWTSRRLEAGGVSILPGQEIISLEKDSSRDHVIVAAGIIPNVSLAEASGLEIDSKTNGIVINAELEARSNVFAAGDVTSYHDVALGRRRVEHYDHAYMSGRHAGLNMTGESKPYNHQSMFWSNIGPEVNFEAVGILDSSLPTVSVWKEVKDTKSKVGSETFDQGIVYYLRNKTVVGVLLWNISGEIENARNIIKSQKRVQDSSVLESAIKIN